MPQFFWNDRFFLATSKKTHDSKDERENNKEDDNNENNNTAGVGAARPGPRYRLDRVRNITFWHGNRNGKSIIGGQGIVDADIDLASFSRQIYRTILRLGSLRAGVTIGRGRTYRDARQNTTTTATIPII